MAAPRRAGAAGPAGRRRDFRRLTGLLDSPLALLGDRAPGKYVWHCAVRAAPGDPDLGDGAWMGIAAEIMDRTGLSRAGTRTRACAWVAVHHGDNHIHIVAVLARQDGRRAALHNDYYRIGEAMRDSSGSTGCVAVARPDRTAARRPGRAETEKAGRRAGEPARVTLRRHVHAAAAAARTEAEFFAGLERRGVRVRLRPSAPRPGQVTGYAVRCPATARQRRAGVVRRRQARRRPVPAEAARRRWAAGRAACRAAGWAAAARAALRREVARAAAAARSEPEFWAGWPGPGCWSGPGRAGSGPGRHPGTR